MHTINPSTLEMEVGGSKESSRSSLRLPWATQQNKIKQNKTQQIHSCFPRELIKVEFNVLISHLRTGDVAQCLVSVYEALGSTPSPCKNWVWWLTSTISALGKWRQKDQKWKSHSQLHPKFKAWTMNPWLQTIKKETKERIALWQISITMLLSIYEVFPTWPPRNTT